MIAAFDVDYRENQNIAVVASIVFEKWTDKTPKFEYISVLKEIAPYIPGRFFERELPCLLHLIEKIPIPITIILIDGYVWLSENRMPGLGGHLYQRLQEKTPVIGVAKRSFKGAMFAKNVFRGKSKRPLFITAAGINKQKAAKNVEKMHGIYRIPTLLKKVDHLARNFCPKT